LQAAIIFSLFSSETCIITPVDRATSTALKEDVMDTEIGEAAGRIWQYLAEHGEVTLRQLQRGTTLPERFLHMGVGWLAREDKLCFRQERGVLRLSLQTQAAFR
jgi:hypothetical protein